MPPRRYLEGFTLCVPLENEHDGYHDQALTRCLVIKAEMNPAVPSAPVLVIRVEIRFFSPGGAPSESDEVFAAEVHTIPFPKTGRERVAQIRRVLAREPLLPTT